MAVLGLLTLLPGVTPAAAQESIEEAARWRAREIYDAAIQGGMSGQAEESRAAETPADTAGMKKSVAGAATATMRCLPTCDPTDGRFLAIAGLGLSTLSPPELELAISVPAGSTSFDLGFFDGDGRELDLLGDTNWDVGTTALFDYTLYADPDADGSGLTVVEMLPGFPTIFSTEMPDNAWRDFTIPTGPEAETPSGNYFYVLRIRLLTPALTLNAFKVRTSSAVLSGLTLDPVARPFSYIASWTSFTDLAIVYPEFPNATPTTYDGTFRFYFDVPVSQSAISVWDGDFDRGKYDLTEQDTDDPNTPNAPFLPEWATIETLPEGVAFGGVYGTGSPPDDENGDGFGSLILRAPSVFYNLTFPDGQTFLNDNPSGNQEWEEFKVATGPFDPSETDHSTPIIPGGTFTLDLQGVDMLNLNALLLPFRVLCVEETGEPCVPLRPFLVGDRVFADTDGNGTQDPGEPGIAGVEVELYDESGVLLGTTTTDDEGAYSFGAINTTYEVRIAASNFTGSGPLAGYASTTGGESQTGTVNGDNNLDFDFGYLGTGSLSGRLWHDSDGDGVQEAGEAGLDGVTVELLDENSDVVATATTGADGDYSFPSLGPGTYTVRVDAATLPGGASPTFDADGTATENTVTVTLEAGEDREEVDFGYRGTASVGDRVWNDLDGDGVQEAGEAGLNGVTVHLLDGDGNVVATTTTSGDGGYSFGDLFSGTYTVSVEPATLPAGYAPTYDADGTATPHQATVALDAGASLGTIDFGYRSSVRVTLGDRVWSDTDGDGIQDGGEPGLANVMVQLLDDSNTVIASTVTNASGSYAFGDLPIGTYTVRIVTSTLPAGVTPTYDADGTATPHQATVTTTTNRSDIDFGYKPAPVCTAGYFKDHFNSAKFSNNDGTLSWTGSWVEHDVAGSGASSGNVTVGKPVSGYLILRDNPNTGTQPSAARQANLSGFASATLTVSFHIRGAEADDVAAIEVSKDGGSTYTVLETLSGYTGNHVSTRSYDLSGYLAGNTRVRFRIVAGYGGSDDYFKVDWVKLDAGCTPPPPTGSIGNRVWKDVDGDGNQDSGEPGLGGVTVQLLSSGGTVLATQTTGADGSYSFGGLAAGTYKVKVVSSTLPSGYTPTYDLDGTGTAHIATVTITAGQNRTDADFGYKPAPVCTAGYFKDHFNSAKFSNNDGTLSWTGSWVENDVAGAGASSGNVTVGKPVSGYLILRDSPDTGTQPSAARQADLSDFASATLTVSFHIRGVEADDKAVIEVSKDGGSTYTVLETLAGYTGTYINSRTFDISPYLASNTRIRFRIAAGYAGSDDYFKVDWVKLDAGCTPPPPPTGSIGNRVWKDVDGDGNQDSGEPGLGGVTVQLLSSGGTVLATQATDGDGSYSFGNLAAGTYKVKVVSSTLPSGYTPTHDLDGTGTAHIATVTITAGQNRTDADFGYRPPAQPGTGTLGYWKNHPQAWPVQQITVGGKTYTKSQAISLLENPGKGDKTYDLFKQLVPAKLNVLIGNDSSCIASTISAADSWLAQHPVGSNIKGNNSAWTAAAPLHEKLDDYNNGRLCAPHRD